MSRGAQTKSPRGRGRPRGRHVEPKALAEVRGLIASMPKRPDLLIEYLHRIQDTYGYLSAAHLVALAHELRLAPTEIYEVATFYHHFDVVKQGDPPPALTIRVCESVTCEMFGANALVESLSQAGGDGVRVQRVPCVGLSLLWRGSLAHL